VDAHHAQAAPKRSVILLHACAHNPTGIDPTLEQWGTIMKCLEERDHLAFFDFAYQGFASGNMEHDAAAIRLFVAAGKECFVAQSFSKNLGFYSERLGCLTTVTSSPDQAQRVASQMKRIIRASYSNPPGHGARVAAQIMTTPALFTEWENELRVMSSRLSDMRQQLYEALVSNNTPGDWSHLQTQIGMFTFLGLTSSCTLHSLSPQRH
jgi:aspartate/tyrosine/aromatic aminotransferase